MQNRCTSPHEIKIWRFLALDLSPLFNRPHGSARVGGGDEASFRTWFSRDDVQAGPVPFIVKRTGDDVLVSANNTQNVFEIAISGEKARALHLLVWGYSYPADGKLRIGFADGTVQEAVLPLQEWTEGKGPVAFDFENTVRGFRHAAIAHRAISIDHSERKIARIETLSGTFGLVAITLEK